MCEALVVEAGRSVEVTDGKAVAEVSLLGGQVMGFDPGGCSGEVLWTGGYEPTVGGACWGGIPLCWPWFMSGPGPIPRGPFHGVARVSEWDVMERGAGWVLLGLRGPLSDRSGEGILLEADLRVTVDGSLRLELITRNTGSDACLLEQCFHAYFRVGDVTACSIHGLDGTEVQDNLVPGGPRALHSGVVAPTGPLARIYRNFGGLVRIDDSVLQRRIEVRSHGARQLVMWNSGPLRNENGRSTGERDWRSQLAVEPLRGLEQAVTLPPGGTARFDLEVTVRPRGADRR